MGSIGEPLIDTPKKKKRNQDITEPQKKENKQKAKKRIFWRASNAGC